MLIYSLIVILLSSAVNLDKDKSIIYSRIFLIVLLNTSIISYNVLYINFLDKGIGIFSGLFNITAVNSVFSLFIFVLSLTVGFLTSFYSRKIVLGKRGPMQLFLYIRIMFNKSKEMNISLEPYRISEYSLVLLFIIIGSILLMASGDLISIFLSIELQSYGLYILSCIYRNSESSTSAGLTYFLLGALASCFILLSTGLLYANSGCTTLDSLYIISNMSDIIDQGSSLDSTILSWYSPYYIHLSLVILSVGFLFKVSAAPFHFWSPDVYDAVPTIVTTFLTLIPKIAIFIFMLDIVINTYKSLYVSDYTWTSVFILSSLASLVIGTVLGLTQHRIKRLFAYSTISHIGFILLALSICTQESIQAFLFYLGQYSISNLNAFLILITIGYSVSWYNWKNTNTNKIVLKEADNSPIQLIEQIKGIFSFNPTLALSLGITLFSFAGVPPLIGFFAKLLVLSSSIDSGYIFMSIVAILTSVIGGVYYLFIIKQMFFEKHDYELSSHVSDLQDTAMDNMKDLPIKFEKGINDNISLSSSLTITISILTNIILLFIFIPTEILNLTSILSLLLFN